MKTIEAKYGTEACKELLNQMVDCDVPGVEVTLNDDEIVYVTHDTDTGADCAFLKSGKAKKLENDDLIVFKFNTIKLMALSKNLGVILHTLFHYRKLGAG